MTRAAYEQDRQRIGQLIADFELTYGALPGIELAAFREAFIEQVVDSEQRVQHFARLQSRDLDVRASDPTQPAFDPIRAAIIHRGNGNIDEAIWLVFLFVHFGKHPVAGWRYSRDVYGRLGSSQNEWWTWDRVFADPESFRWWLDGAQSELLRPPRPHGFGNHRKRESLSAWSDKGTGAAVETYVDWIASAGGTHDGMLSSVDGLSAHDKFARLYDSMSAVMRFGRVGKFDYLMTLRKLGFTDAAPEHSYIVGSTGPLSGARLLLDDQHSHSTPREAQAKLQLLSAETGITPDVIEDAVCNWQKSPGRYVKFRG